MEDTFPFLTAALDFIQIRLHAAGKADIDNIREVLLQERSDDLSQRSRLQIAPFF